MGKIFCVEFQRVPLKFHTKYLAHTLNDIHFYTQVKILKVLRFNSQWTSWHGQVISRYDTDHIMIWNGNGLSLWFILWISTSHDVFQSRTVMNTVFPLTHNRCEVVISWWSPLLPKISIYATKCEYILEKSGIFIHLQSKYCINLSCKKNLTISWVQIAARW